MYEFRIYLKRDLEQNPRDPKVSKIYKDELAAQSYSRKLSESYDVVMMKIDPDLFSMDYQLNQGSVYYGLGIDDVVFYPKRHSLNSTMGSSSSSTGYSKRTTNYGSRTQATGAQQDAPTSPHIPNPPSYYVQPRGFWWNLKHGIGVLIRFSAVCCIFYFFAMMIQDHSITISLPSGGAGTSTYDVGHGAREIAIVLHDHGVIIYQHLVDYAIKQGYVDRFNELWNMH